MSWNDDSWRDGYDAWKLRSPDDDYYDDGCDHEDYDIDTIEGRCQCYRCGESWWASEDEILAAIDQQAAYAKWEEEQNRRKWWRDLTFPIRWRLFAVIQRIWPRKAKKLIYADDEIPF